MTWGLPFSWDRCPRAVSSARRRSGTPCNWYVTWGEHKRVYAYLPHIRRRILVGRAPAGFVRGRKLNVVHTCDRIFARMGDTIYEALRTPAGSASLSVHPLKHAHPADAHPVNGVDTGRAMSQENVEFIQQAADALHKGDLQRVEALLEGALDPAFEYQSFALDQVTRV
jgi:hypothetical protein